MSLSAEILWQSQSLIINKWFPVNEYALATSLVMVTSVVMLIGFTVTGVVFTRKGEDTIGNLNDLIWYSNIVVTFIFMFFMTTFRETPDIPPSRVATHEPPKQDLTVSFSELHANRNFWIICISFTLA